MPVLLNIRFLAAVSEFPGRVTDVVSSRYLRTSRLVNLVYVPSNEI